MIDESRLQEVFEAWERAKHAGDAPDLGDICDGDSELADALRVRIASFDAIDDVFGINDTSGSNSWSEGGWSTVPPVGSMVGRFRLLKQLGEGGFGVVYEAERRDGYHERVALKVLRRDVGSTEGRVRFAAEGQALALVRHPNIASVLDAGVSDEGIPYIAMDLIEGVPLKRFCAESSLSVREKLELMLPVCEAVGHAHAKGVIHRDLKPGNVLVTGEGSAAVAKVIDFGIARITTPVSGQDIRVTRENEFLGTVAYMSPEQLGVLDGDADTRSDIYSLGVMLYEVFSGSLPYEREGDRRIDAFDLRQRMRSGDPKSLTSRMRGVAEAVPLADSRKARKHGIPRELSWIVMRCLEVDPERRYATCRELAEDIRRYLAGEPVGAGPRSKLYITQKFVQRNRAGVAVVAALLLALVIAAGGVVYGLVRAIDERELARQAAAEARWEQYVAALQAVNSSLHSDDSLSAKLALRSVPEEYVGWEYDYLKFRTDSSERVYTFDNQMYSVRYDAESKDLYAVGRGGIVARFEEFGGAVSETRKLPQNLHSLEISPDGEWIVFVGSGGELYLADKKTMTVRDTAHFSELALLRVIFRDPRTLVASGRAHEVRAYTIDESGGTPGLRPGWVVPTDASVFAMAFVRGVLWIGDEDGDITFVDPDSGAVLGEQGLSTARIHDIEAVPGTDHVIACTRGGELKLMRVSEDGLSFVVERDLPTFDPVAEVAVLGDGSMVIAAMHSGGIASYTLPDMNALEIRYGHDGRVYSVAAFPGEIRIASAATDGTIRVWDFDGVSPHMVFGRPAPRSGTQTETTSTTKFVAMPPVMREGAESPESYRERNGLQLLAQDDAWFVAWSKEQSQVIVLDKSSLRELARIPVDEPQRAASVCAGDRTLALVGLHGNLRYGKIDEEGWHAEPFAEDRVWVRSRVTVSPGMLLYSAFDGRAQIWENGVRRELTLDLSGSEGFYTALSPDGERLAVVMRPPHGDRVMLRVYDTRHGRPLLTVDGNFDKVHGVWFSADGSQLVLQEYGGATHRYTAGRHTEDRVQPVGDGEVDGVRKPGAVHQSAQGDG